MLKIPEQLLNSLSELKSFDKEAFVEAHQEKHKITSIRLNPLKKTDALSFQTNDSVKWCHAAFYLEERPSFTHDPLFHAGCYYVQEAGSMFLELALKQTLNFSDNLKILDVCAAPGGKSTLINSLLNESSLLVANEFVKSRADILAHNLSKWGTCNSVVTNNEPKRFSELTHFFDAIVIDAPCSGSGLFRKQPEAINEWSESAVTACSIRQQKILEDCIPALKENGILIYSTCSFSVEENENSVDWAIREFNLEYVPLTLPKDTGIIESDKGYRFYPHLTKSEGFFCAVLRKKGSTLNQHHYRIKNNFGVSKNEESLMTQLVNQNNNFLLKINERFHLANQEVVNFLSVFEKQFYFRKAGTVIGEIKGTDVIPNHELALSLNISTKVNVVDLDKENALAFLRKNNFITSESKKGFTLITYKNYGLGWAKLLGNRINNYLPNELRILK